MQITQLTTEEFQQRCQSATVLAASSDQLKLLQTDDGLILKLFRPRKLLTSAKIWPHAIRFYKNAQQLQALGIASVTVRDIFYCRKRHTHGVYYDRISGADVRQLNEQNNLTILNSVAQLLAQLHQQGIFFRGIHLGNLIVNKNTLYLIDITDLKVISRPLPLRQRARNIIHMLQHRKDIATFVKFGINAFVDTYLQHAQLNDIDNKTLKNIIYKKIV